MAFSALQRLKERSEKGRRFYDEEDDDENDDSFDEEADEDDMASFVVEDGSGYSGYAGREESSSRRRDKPPKQSWKRRNLVQQSQSNNAKRSRTELRPRKEAPANGTIATSQPSRDRMQSTLGGFMQRPSRRPGGALRSRETRKAEHAKASSSVEDLLASAMREIDSEGDDTELRVSPRLAGSTTQGPPSKRHRNRYLQSSPAKLPEPLEDTLHASVPDRDDVKMIDSGVQRIDLEEPGPHERMEKKEDCSTETFGLEGWPASPVLVANGIHAPSPPRRASIEHKVENTDEFPSPKHGFLHLFWIDAYEDAIHKPGTVFLFGKTLDPQTEHWRSVCVVIKNIERCMYALPRLVDPEAGVDGERVKVMEVYNEIEKKRRRLGVHKWVCRPKTMKYCFRERGKVPAETEYLQVRYSFLHDPLIPDRPGETYERIFGARSSALELFLLDKELMGPCWLRVPFDGTASATRTSWCKMEVHLDDSYASVEKLSSNYPPPTLKILSLSMQTTMNKRKEHEIACLGMSLHHRTCVEGENKDTEPHEYSAIVRKINRNPFPYGLQDALRRNGYDTKKCLKTVGSERELLNFFVVRMQQVDADVIVAHKLFDFFFDVIYHRAEKFKLQQWSKMGRLRHSKMPLFRGRLQRKKIACGRLLVDTFLSAQEFIHESTYTLSHLVNTQLKVANHQNYDVNKIPDLWLDADCLAKLICHCVQDSRLVLQLMFQLQVLPLTKELTGLCGNLWQRSLMSQRAERNEYLLLHQFRREGFIAPEKYTKKEKIERGIIEDDGSNKRRKKAQYAGGLVLEPEKGLYDKMVLLLDFNSLYPSIIQEYNLCFTTVSHWLYDRHSMEEHDVNTEKMRPGNETPNGILPEVIGVLLKRRTQVKRTLKNTSNREARDRLDIQQKALKLVANSMYGCLGFGNSRFYCKPLASLITALGRESLASAKHIAETVDDRLRVIYGDTDSIMVYTNTGDLKEAKRMGYEVKKKINKTYRKMYLELDEVFSKMLLLRKKKYAALKITSTTVDPRGVAKHRVEREIKGLDLVRRDWSIISKEIGERVLDTILSDQAVDDVVRGVHDCLRTYATSIAQNKVPLEKFIITKKLTKHPTQYPDAKKQPHVQVALHMDQMGIQVNVGTFVPYIICTRFRDGSDIESKAKSSSLAMRAYHMQEIVKSQSCVEEKERLRVDRKWYLETQILPPVARLCDPIEGTDMGQLANALGLDSGKFHVKVRASHGAFEDEDDSRVAALSDPADRYQHCEKFKVSCRHCKASYDFVGIFNFALDGRCGLKCATPGCRGLIAGCGNLGSKERPQRTEQTVEDVVFLKNSISLQIDHYLQRYYDSEWVCLDPTCKVRTPLLPLSGNECPKSVCSSLMRQTYSSEDLLRQMRFFHYLFDLEKARKELFLQQKKNNLIEDQLTQLQCDTIKEIRHFIETEFLHKCEGYFVDTGALFKFIA